MTADLLRRAADLIEQRAAQATRGPWSVEESENSWDLYGASETLNGMPMHPLKIVKAPKRMSTYAEYWPYSGDTAWLLMMGPQVAAPLAAWLRHIATEWDRIAHLDDGTSDHPALALARSIVGEQP